MTAIADFCIARPLQLVIDDVGWWRGSNGSSQGEPYRTGIGRLHQPADYCAIADLGRALGIRPMIAMVLGEWDTTGILREVPGATWSGSSWQPQREFAAACDAAAAILRERRADLEFTLHGLGHEFWDESGAMSRAEWYDNAGQMRPAATVRRHLDAYRQLMRQHQLGEFPKSFVPCAFRYAFGRGENELAGILRDYGVEFISTPFSSMVRHREPESRSFGFDAGIMVADRDGMEINWDALQPDPADCTFEGAVCGLHWPNLLAADPARNSEETARWIAALRRVGARFGRMLSPDSTSYRRQLAYHELTGIRQRGPEVELDFSRYLQLFGSHAASGVVVHQRDPRTGRHRARTLHPQGATWSSAPSPVVRG